MHTSTQQSPGAASWKITAIEAIEPAGNIVPDNIVEKGKPFSLKVAFTGDGAGFKAYANLKAPFKVIFSIDGLGNDTEKSLDPVSGTLEAGRLDYEVVVPVDAVLLEEGLYLLGCVITFSPTIPGMVGFIEHLPLEIYV